MKEVLLHIGTHKTGSTTIQHAMKGYDDGVTRSARFEHSNHSIPMFTIFSKQRNSYHVWRNQGLTAVQVEERRKSYLAQLRSDLADESRDRLIISGEDMTSLQPEDIHDMLDFIAAEGVAIKALVYVRSPTSMVASSVQQRIKSGHLLEKFQVNYRRKIEPYVESLSKEAVEVRDFDTLVATGKDLVEDFSEVAGIKLTSVPALNESLSLPGLALTLRLNRIPLHFMGNKARYAARRRIATKIANAFSPKKGYAKVPKEIFHYLIDPNAREDCDWLNQTFGTEYNSPPVDGSVPTAEIELDASLDGLRIEIERMFTDFGVAYDSKRSLEENFLETLVTLLERQKTTIDFDPQRYLALNPDVAAAKVNPYEHFLKNGLRKGRKY
ncbi:hypothetical protein KUV47_06025 [Vannielia litorea]|uniref:hypothetical protein n=1 Tax=Vannielia litorea TaxID=1217970 RepID=UPI001C97C376|nr:hypothetical protein [Vannielia litorea]MBY6152761.1 hypothetical protein [Vannielia litorea]